MDKGNDPPRGSNNCKHMHTVPTQHIQLHKINTNGNKGTDRPQHNNSGWLDYPTIIINRSSNQKIKKISELNGTVEQIDVTDTYRIFHPITTVSTFSAAHGAFSKIVHSSGHKASFISRKL
jgi:hypothetical protein